MTQASTAELIAALYLVEGKAEIIGGEIVLMSLAGGLHNGAAMAIYRSLWEYERRRKSGWAVYAPGITHGPCGVVGVSRSTAAIGYPKVVTRGGSKCMSHTKRCRPGSVERTWGSRIQ